ncbi:MULTISPECIES: LysE family translocator [Microvirga]|uniref:Putative threonine efflux protein n=1 Tax=Microvirga lotononidis TaxID=864069 RepID=I4Z4X1_9HYPH|nr:MULTISPECIES: LysE family transporter [Microvirga]EIM31263.1 putative threonine efflux protein [Microvirga lotononidis]WQO29989.1 LysE family transporter [Microvirga lotononidis]
MQDNVWTTLTTLSIYAGVIISPGPNFALVSRLAMSGALPSALGATLGLSLAATFYAVLSMTGLAVLIVRVDWVASAIQIVGGAYLVYLGISNWSSSAACDDSVPPSSRTFWSGLRVGTLVELTNPKGIVFFLGLYAVAISADADTSVKLIVLLGGFVLEMVWYGFVAMLMSSPPAQAAYRKSRAWIDRFAGTLLIGFGIKMLSERL